MTQNDKQTAIPKLRFSKFRNAPAWTSKELRSIAEPVSERAKEEDANHILTLSAEHGLVLQSEYFGKQVAGTNAERYFKIRRNDFVYNDRTTKASEYGTIKRLTKYPHGIVSPIYKCFRFRNEESSGFWEFYFESGAHEWQLRNLANEGARAGRFNVTIERFLSTRVFSPETSSGEQQKIAECLSTLDELIEAESRKLDALKDHKKGLMQQLFPREGETRPRLRLPEFQNAPDWEEKSIGDVGEVVTGSTPSTAKREYYGGDIPFVSPADISELRFVETTKTTLTELGFAQTRPIRAGSTVFVCIGSIGKVAQIRRDSATNQQINSVIPNSDHDDAFVYYALVQNADRVTKLAGVQTVPIVNKSQFSSVPLMVPRPDEQRRIAACLSSLDDLIAAQSEKLKALRTHKRGLMQQLFPSPDAIDP